ncbi:hypothetical protein [Natronobacterium lacisalsi]|uniref:hypothetical protein n=1 Tax=Natronobacterium lacisalsi TaxID=229731 RepID=UPI001267E255|nr:hypothetical protein [Halobiforma lacisalsi]
MKRRRFITGAAAISLGGSIVVGSSAFSSVEANRGVTFEIESDQYAYLELDDISNNFTKTEGGLLHFRFDEEVTPPNGTFEDTGDGVSPNTIYEFTDLFQARNRGSDDIVMFGEYDGSDLKEIELIEKGRKSALTESNPSTVIKSPGAAIDLGLRIQIGDVPLQKISTEFTIIAVSEDSEKYPDVFPSDKSSS